MKKWAIFGGAGAGVVVAAVVLVLLLTGKGKAYRSIIVVEVEGKVSVSRDGNNYDAYPQMKLRSGDGLSVPAGGFARLKLDGDKYVYLEENTVISLQAAGTAANSKTIIYIEQGSMLTEIQKKLSSKSSYDVVTPNTTMAIRGTVTQTIVWKVAPGDDLSVLKGLDEAGMEYLKGLLAEGKTCNITYQYVLEGTTEITVYEIVDECIVYSTRTVPAGSGLYFITTEEQTAGTIYVRNCQVFEVEVFWGDKAPRTDTGTGDVHQNTGATITGVFGVLYDGVIYLFPDDVNPEAVSGAGGKLPQAVIDAVLAVRSGKPIPTQDVTAAPTKTPTPTEAPTETPTLTETPTPTEEPSETPTPTEEPTGTVTPTPKPTNTPTPKPKATNTPTPKPTNTPTPTAKVNTPTPTQAQQQPAQNTPTPTATSTPTPTPTAVPTHTITYMDKAGNKLLNLSPSTYKEGEGVSSLPYATITKLTSNQKDSYNAFNGWTYNGQKITEIPATFKEDIILVADEDNYLFSVYFHDYDFNTQTYFETNAPITSYSTYNGIPSGSFPVMSSPSGYSFYGWKNAPNGTIVNQISAGSTGDVNLYADYRRVYTITYRDDKGSVLLPGDAPIPANAPGYYLEGSGVTLPILADESSRGFLGWDNYNTQPTEKLTSIAQGTNASLELIPVWGEVITIEYSDNYTSTGTTATIVKGRSFTPMALSDTAEKDFAGWYNRSRSVVVGKNAALSEDDTSKLIDGELLNAEWSYTITFCYDDGTPIPGMQYKVKDSEKYSFNAPDFPTNDPNLTITNSSHWESNSGQSSAVSYPGDQVHIPNRHLTLRFVEQ